MAGGRRRHDRDRASTRAFGPGAGRLPAEVRPKGFTEQGLVYEAGPYAKGIGTTYLLRPDGSTVQVDLPEGAHIPDSSTGDVALRLGYATDISDTCVTSYRLVDAQWVENGTGCMGTSLEEAQTISPDRHWLIIDELPRVWDLQAGEFVTVDMPREVVTSRGNDLVGGIAGESDAASSSRCRTAPAPKERPRWTSTSSCGWCDAGCRPVLVSWPTSSRTAS